jgi:transposase
MDIHKNARLTPHSRAELVRRVLIQRQTTKAVATAFGVCVKTVQKWVDRFVSEGEAGLTDRSSRPHRLRQPTARSVVEEIERLRRERWTGKQIAAETGVSPATVSRVLRRLGLKPCRRWGKAKLAMRRSAADPTGGAKPVGTI